MTEQAKLPFYLVVTLASIFIIMLGIKITASIINPILLAVVITIAVLPLPQMLIKRGLSGKLALVLTILTVVGAIVLVIAMVGGSIYALKLKLPSYAADIASRTNELAQSEYAQLFTQSFAEVSKDEITLIAGKSLSLVANALAQVFITLLIFIFMLAAALSTPSSDPKSDETSKLLLATLREFTKDVSKYVRVTTVINFLVGLGDTIFLMILGVDFAILWGLLAWFLGYIPTIGFWLALIPPTILAWAEHGTTTAIIVFIGFVLINGSVQNFLQPKMMGDNLNLSPILVFLSLFVWGWLLGAIGAILAVPMTLLVLAILDQFPTTRKFVRLLRGNQDDNGALEAKRELRGWWGRFRFKVGLESTEEVPSGVLEGETGDASSQ